MCLLLKPVLNILKKTLAVYNSYNKYFLRPYSVYQTIAINKPLPDIFITSLWHYPSD